MAGREWSYCPRCGEELSSRRVEGRIRQFCDRCDRPLYRNPKPCAGVVVVDEGRLLLIRRTEAPATGSWSIPAGYLEADEPPRAAAVRELREETSLSVPESEIELFDTAFVEHPDGWHVLVLVYVAPRSKTRGSPEAGDDAGAAKFWDIEALIEGDERLEPGYRSMLRAVMDHAEGRR